MTPSQEIRELRRKNKQFHDAAMNSFEVSELVLKLLPIEHTINCQRIAQLQRQLELEKVKSTSKTKPKKHKAWSQEAIFAKHALNGVVYGSMELLSENIRDGRFLFKKHSSEAYIHPVTKAPGTQVVYFLVTGGSKPRIEYFYEGTLYKKHLDKCHKWVVTGRAPNIRRKSANPL